MTVMKQSAFLSPFLIISAAATDVGKVRSLNEDAVLNRADDGVWAVADGMGGHQRGDFASASITEALRAMPVPAGASALMAQLRTSLDTVNSQLIAQRRNEREIIASTLVCLLIADGYFACVWAGDSRLYLLRDGTLSRISTDHSVVQELLDAGAITPEQAEHHPRGNEVTRAVGATDELLIDIRQGRVFPRDYFLLCSDGLFKVVTEKEIAAHLAGDPATIAESLIALALNRGAPDNVSVVVVCCLNQPTVGNSEETQIITRRMTDAG